MILLLMVAFSTKAQTPVWDGSIAYQFGGGTGTEADPYLISQPCELVFLSQKVNEGTNYAGTYFKLMSDVDLNNLNWTVIGEAGAEKPFNGNFDGNNKKIINLKVEADIYAGFFGWVHTSGKIENLEILSGSVVILKSDEAKNIYAGGIAAYSQGAVINCRNGAQVQAMSDCSAGTVTISAGGIVGENYGSIDNCLNTAGISAKANAANFSAMTNSGGIAGRSYGSIRNVYNRGEIISEPFYAGGIVGHNAGSEIQNAYNTGHATSTWSQIGAITANGAASNSFYLEGCVSMPGGGVAKTSDEMKASDFLNMLNADQTPAIWIHDYEVNINDGFPILYYQQPLEKPGVVITITDGKHGKIRVLKDGAELTPGTKVDPGTKLSLVAVPDDNYILKCFTSDGAAVFGNTFEVYADADLSAEFEYVEGVVRWDGTVAEEFAYGTGTKKNPYQIRTGQELALLSKRSQENAYDASVYFKLMNPVDLQMKYWTPIGTDADHPFSANFDGNHQVIANLYVKNETYTNSGLFGYVNQVEIKNLGIVGNSIVLPVKDYANAGMLAGINYGYIMNCYASGIIKSALGSRCGGLVARNGGMVSNAYFKGTVEVTDHAFGAGICAENTKMVKDCYNVGNVKSSSYTALVGAVATDNTGEILNCYYLDSSCTEAGGGILKTTAEMQTTGFVTSLNAQSPDVPWMADNSFRNQGYPILKWQAGAIFPIGISQVPEGALKVYADESELADSDCVRWGTRLRFSAAPAEDFIVENFIYDDRDVFGEEQAVYDTAKVSVSFVREEGILRWNGSVASSFGGGSGSKEDPYLINTPDELAYLASQVNKGVIYEDKYFKQTHSFDLCHREWTPIGIDNANAMSGSYDGGGHIIANLRCTAVSAGLFGIVSEVSKEIKNIGLKGINILRNPDVIPQGEVPCAGLIAAKNHTLINRCYTKGGDVYSLQQSGGIAGSNFGTVRNVYSYNMIRSELYAGGIVGANSGSITGVYSISDVTSEYRYQNYVGGISGMIFEEGTDIKNAYYMEGKGTDVGGGLAMPESEMKRLDFVNLLNANQKFPAWSTDLNPNINKGFPILKWQDPRKFTITVAQSEKGRIEPGTTEVSFGENLLMNILPDADCDVVDVLVDGTSVGAVDNYTFTNITEDHSISAFFALKQYTIETIQTTGGNISPGTVHVESGKSMTFTVTPDDGYDISALIVDDVTIPAAASYTFTNVTTDHSISAEFCLKTAIEAPMEESGERISVLGKEIRIESSSDGMKQVRLFDISGKHLQTYLYQYDCMIGLKHSGTYLLHIDTCDRTVCRKLIVR